MAVPASCGARPEEFRRGTSTATSSRPKEQKKNCKSAGCSLSCLSSSSILQNPIQPAFATKPRTRSTGTINCHLVGDEFATASTRMDMDEVKSTGSGGGSALSAHVNKSGRKGDPRMHRAVAARLANPSLSLFEALRAGGFDYSMDDDSQAIDADQVTLGQRKNQLSRRIRIARRDATVGGGGGGQGGGGGSGGDGGASVGTKRSNQDLLEDFDEGDNNSADETTVRVVKAKNHPDYRGPIIVLPARRQNGGRPPSHSLDETAAPLLGNDGMGLGMSGNSYPSQPFAQGNPLSNSSGGSVPVPLGGMGSISPPNGFPSSLPSGVAVASLNSTAQKIGMTLEQLALSLSQCSNLARVLTAITSDPADQEDRREKLAQNLCMAEVRSLYSKCMLMAGYSLEQASDDSRTCIEFAVKAWQNEGRRLEELVRSRNLGSSFYASSSNLSGRDEESYRMHHRHGSNQKIPGGGAGHRHGANDDCGSNGGSHPDQGRSFPSEDGRHSHRLQGCGHKAILHQPADGPAHIDFVVGDKIECYQGLQPPMGPAEHTNQMNIWPSQYRCDEVRCENPGCGGPGTSSSSNQPSLSGDEASNALPRILDISSLDLDGKEWISAVDDTLLSLFKLSDSSPTDGKSSE